MAVLRIPLPQNVPSFTQRVLLESSEYVFDFRWNQRESRWYLVFSDTAEVPIWAGKLTPDWPLLAGVVDARRPPGELILMDSLKTEAPAGLGDLDRSFVLRYVEAVTVAEIEAG